MRQATGQRMRAIRAKLLACKGAICAKLLANGCGPYAPSYWPTDGAICAKLLANGSGHMRQATGYRMGPYAPCYWLPDRGICAKLLATGWRLYAPSYWLRNGGYMRQATS